MRTHFARPNWKKVFTRVANIHKGSTIGMQCQKIHPSHIMSFLTSDSSIFFGLFFSHFASFLKQNKNKNAGVFYCGPLMLAKELENLVKVYNHSSSTRFEFHKENF